MKKAQQGFGLVLLIIGLALLALLFGVYFTRSGSKQQSQYEAGQEGIQQAQEINQKSYEQSQQIQKQLELQNEVNAE